jgi:hypothetical protein
MKRLGFALLLLMACEDNGETLDLFTGNEVVYTLEAGSTYAITGTLTIKEKKDGSAFILTELTGTEGSLQHPVHLHLGDLSVPDAEVAALLSPVLGSSGKSETTLTTLANETSVSYEQLVQLNACVRIHLAESGPGRDIILAGANIGTAIRAASNSRIGIAVCQ